MPEGYTHVRTALKAIAAIHYKLESPVAFAAGANGPDTLFGFEAWKPGKKRVYNLPELGNRMHEEKTGAFLQSMLRHVKTRAQIEYTLGFLCHYATDTVVHPYVYAMCEKGMPYGRKGGHGYFEIALDSTLHAEDTGVSRVSADSAGPVPVGAELAEISALLHTCLLETYAMDIPVEFLADAFYDTNRMRKLFASHHGFRKIIFWLIEPLFGGRGAITGHVSPRHLALDLPDDWTDPFTGEARHGNAFALLRDAQKRSELYMNGALQNWMGVLPTADLERLLGSMSYTEGRETPQSNPAPAPAANTDAPAPAQPQDAVQS